MKLKTLLDLKKGSVVSIVGAGGKTSFLFSLAEELRNSYKVLVTTSTKIYIPQKTQYDFIVVEEDNKALIEEYCESDKKGIYIFGNLHEEKKLKGLSETTLINISKYFDYILIEADGSKRKPLKGWADAEPVIYDNTTVTVGILDIQVLGKEINENIVHRAHKFLELTESHINETVELGHLENLVLKPKGLFKNSIGEKILFINKTESDESMAYAKELAENLLLEDRGNVDKIFIGSLKYNNIALVIERK